MSRRQKLSKDEKKRLKELEKQEKEKQKQEKEMEKEMKKKNEIRMKNRQKGLKTYKVSVYIELASNHDQGLFQDVGQGGAFIPSSLPPPPWNFEIMIHRLSIRLISTKFCT